MYYGEYQLGRARMQQIREEVQHNRLEAALAKSNRSERANDARKSLATRVATVVAALTR